MKPRLYVDTWEERDRLHIALRYDDASGDTMELADWWDDDARQMFENGFFRGRDRERSVIEYAQEMGLLKHYTYGSGEHGCLYDNGPHLAWLRKDAVNALTDTFELGRTRKARLNRNGYLRLSRRDGAEYCEIVECDCCSPEDHDGE